MNDVTHLLERVQQGNLQAAEELLPLIYQELRKLAAHKLAGEAAGQTLQLASHDRKVKLWNVATHQELVTFSFAAHLLSARFSPDGRALAVSYFNERGMHIELIRAPDFEQIAAAESSQTTGSPR